MKKQKIRKCNAKIDTGYKVNSYDSGYDPCPKDALSGTNYCFEHHRDHYKK